MLSMGLTAPVADVKNALMQLQGMKKASFGHSII
jgi:hypothetical protein